MPQAPQPTDPTPQRHGGHPGDANAVASQFIRELIVFLIGLLIGFFWYYYSDATKSPDANIVIGLVVIIVCMVRYIFLHKKPS